MSSTILFIKLILGTQDKIVLREVIISLVTTIKHLDRILNYFGLHIVG